MFRIALFTIFVCSFATTQGQTVADLNRFFQEKKYPQAQETAYTILQNGSAKEKATAWHLLGWISIVQKKYDSTLFFMQKAIEMDQDASWISGWSYAVSGEAYLGQGDTAQAITALSKAVQLNTTKNCVQYAKHLLELAERKDITQQGDIDWQIAETEHIKFFFQDINNLPYPAAQYMARRERAYETINACFKAQLPKKLAMMVWDDPKMAEKTLGRALGFSRPEEYVCMVHARQTPGHEITHVLSYWGWGVVPTAQTRLINEGVAVAFDQDGDSTFKYERARKSARNGAFTGIENLWAQSDAAREELMYPIGGAFLVFLFNRASEQQFKTLMKEQTVDAAKKQWGGQLFYQWTAEFDAMMGLANRK